jgi:hypothetical protein
VSSLALVAEARAGWTDEIRNLVPGAHVAVLADSADVGIEGRLVGLELRDTILVLRSGPSSGFVFLFRKPVAEATVAEQVIATGTGGVNITGTRVGTGADKGIWPILGRTDARNSTAGSMKASETDTATGRWPSNVVLVHGPGCKQEGTKTVERGGGLKRATSGTKTGNVYGKFGELITPQYGGEEGVETVAAWQCEDGCPVVLLDGISGLLKSGMMKAGQQRNMTRGLGGYHDNFPDEATAAGTYGDAGGASRFYPQFGEEAELRAWIARLVTPAAA